ncbi:MAG: SusC/RagA family TonB-linked outer membrane protein [Prevotella sp.]
MERLHYTQERLHLRRMLLTLFLTLTVSLMSLAQGDKAITVNFKGQKATDVMQKIESLIGEKIQFNYADLNFIVTYSAKEKPAIIVINDIVKDHGLTVVRNVKTKSLTVRKLRQGEKRPVIVVNSDIIIKGVVVDDDGEPLVGASVSINNERSTITNGKGEYTLVAGSGSQAVKYSFVGFRTLTLPASKAAKTGRVVLEADNTLEDVVVTGYQKIDRRELTSSIVKIEAKDLEQIGALTVDQMLEGKAPGLLVSNLSTTPGASSKVRVRASGTFTGSREPLWVIDGIPYEDPVPLSAAEINSFDNVNLIGNALSGLNPQDIESINILKDASATAIYGTRAANGVIVITTKRGKAGRSHLNYSGTLNVQQRPTYSDFNLMNSKERIDVSREIYERGLAYPENIISYVGYEGALRDYLSGSTSFSEFQDNVSRLETLNTDWFKELYRNSVSHTHNVNLSGGANNTRYYFSVGYNDNRGMEKGVDLNRLTARSNLDVDVFDNLKIQLSMSGSVQEAKYNHSSVNLFNTAYYTSRAIPCRNDDGSLFYIDKQMDIYSSQTITGRYNILREMENSEKTVSNKDLNITATVNWDILPGIKFTGTGAYRNTTNINEEWITEDTYYIANLRKYDVFSDKIDDLVNKESTVPFGGLYSNGHTSQRSYTLKAQLNLNKVLWRRHVVNLNLGYELNSVKYLGTTGNVSPGYNHSQGRSFITLPSYTINTDGTLKSFGYINMLKWLTGDGSLDIYPSITDRLSNKMSYLAIFNYTYDNRYVFNFNMRSDGSNTFGQYERYKFRPAWSVSGRWNIHKEKFMPKKAACEELALRVSYGFRGTSPSALPYMIIKNYQYNSNYNENLAQVSSLPNANLTWEKTSTVNVGLNHSWFGGRLSGSFDFAYSKSTDLLLSRKVSLVNGQATQLYNGGSKEDYSYEMDLRGVIIKTKDWGLSANFNLTHSHERVLAGYESETLDIYDYLSGTIYQTGFPTDAFYSYQFDGLDENGLPTFKNLQETGTMAEYFSKVLTYSGRRTPTVYGGFGMELRWKDLTVSSTFSYKLGHHVRLLSLYNGNQNMPMPYENMSSEFVNRWRQPGDEATCIIPALSNERLSVGESSSYDVQVTYSEIVPSGNNNLWYMYDHSDARVVRGDFIRWQNLTLRYNMPRDIIKRIGLSTATLSMQVSNLGVWAFDGKLKGQDPEQVQSIGLPAARSYNFALNISF